MVPQDLGPIFVIFNELCYLGMIAAVPGYPHMATLGCIPENNFPNGLADCKFSHLKPRWSSLIICFVTMWSFLELENLIKNPFHLTKEILSLSTQARMDGNFDLDENRFDSSSFSALKFEFEHLSDSLVFVLVSFGSQFWYWNFACKLKIWRIGTGVC